VVGGRANNAWNKKSEESLLKFPTPFDSECLVFAANKVPSLARARALSIWRAAPELATGFFATKWFTKTNPLPCPRSGDFPENQAGLLSHRLAVHGPLGWGAGRA